MRSLRAVCNCKILLTQFGTEMKRLMTIFSMMIVATMIGCGPSGGSDEPVEVITSQDSGPTSDAGSTGSETGTSDAATADARNGSPDVSPDTGGMPSGVPVLGDGEDSLDAVELTTVVESSAGLDGPRDIAFNPESPDQLWIVNRNDHSTVVVSKTGTSSQSSTKYDGANSRHFLAKPAALAFGQPGRMATAQQENKKTQPMTPPDFMGVTLWSTDLSTFNAGHTGHLDMLHNSPLASGIAWEEKNAYWVFDGSHGAISRYDFHMDHGPGGTDHKDGEVRRYLDGQLKVKEGVVAHVDLDRDTGLLYIADTGNQRILELDTNTGNVGGAISPNYDGSDQKYVLGAESRTLVDGSKIGLKRPAGLELEGDRLFVSDNETSTIFAFDKEGEQLDSLDLSDRISEGGTMGMAFDDKGQLYVVNADDDTVLRIAPKTK